MKPGAKASQEDVSRRRVTAAFVAAILIAFWYLTVWYTAVAPDPDMLRAVWAAMLQLATMIIAFYYAKTVGA